jgi:hypothetical protein
MPSLTHDQSKQLREALISAFPKLPQLEMMVEDKLSEKLNCITHSEPNYEFTVKALITWAVAQGKVQELIFGASQANPNNPKLKAFILEDALQRLISILTGIDFALVSKAYQACCPGRRREAPVIMADLIRQLANMPGEADEQKPLWSFVDLLIRDQRLAPDTESALQTWARAQGIVLSVVPLGIVENYLMVKVEPRGGSLGYRISAAIVQDPAPDERQAELIETQLMVADGTNPKYAPGYHQDELVDVLSDLIDICGDTPHEIALTELTVQWFLPTELLSLPVEHWQIRIGRNQRPCNGERCKAVIVRSYDRHFPPYAKSYKSMVGEWKRLWRQLLANQETHCDRALESITVQVGINGRNPDVVGYHFTEHADWPQQENLWDQVLSRGAPVALWLRQAGTDPQVAESMMQAVRDCPIAELPSSLANQRREALPGASEADRLRSAPIALLWDNPFRPFPTIDYPST